MDKENELLEGKGNCLLVRSKCEGYDHLYNYYLLWVFEGRVFHTRVEPIFKEDKRAFASQAKTISSDTKFSELFNLA